jgi:hypothetical protein
MKTLAFALILLAATAFASAQTPEKISPEFSKAAIHLLSTSASAIHSGAGVQSNLWANDVARAIVAAEDVAATPTEENLVHAISESRLGVPSNQSGYAVDSLKQPCYLAWKANLRALSAELPASCK